MTQISICYFISKGHNLSALKKESLFSFPFFFFSFFFSVGLLFEGREISLSREAFFCFWNFKI